MADTNNRFVSLSSPIIVNIASGVNLIFSNNVFENTFGGIVNSSSSSYSVLKKVDFTGNYWGAANTQELDLIGPAANVSFITDYYDNFEHTRVDYSNWATEPWTFAGYRGDNFIDFDFKINNDAVEAATTTVTLDYTVFTSKAISQVRYAQSVTELMSASWESYSASKSFTFDPAKIGTDKYVYIYTQLKDVNGYESGIIIKKIIYDIPEIYYVSLANNFIFTDETTCQMKYKIKEIGGPNYTKIYLNDKEVFSSGFGNEQEVGSNVFDILNMPNGSYVFRIEAYDQTNKSTQQIINFTINKTLDTSSYGLTKSYNSDGTFIKDGKTMYLWRIDGTSDEVDGGNQIGYDNETALGFGTSARVWSSDTIPVDLTTNQYTIEFWTKVDSERSLYFYKNAGFRFYIYNWIWGRYFYMENYYNNSGSYGGTSYNIGGFTESFLNSWHYYTIVYNGERELFYIDGELVFTNPLAYPLYNSSDKLYINHEGGLMDEIRISKFSRTADEIKQYYDLATTKIVRE